MNIPYGLDFTGADNQVAGWLCLAKKSLRRSAAFKTGSPSLTVKIAPLLIFLT